MLESMIIMPDQTAEQVCMVEIEYAMGLRDIFFFICTGPSLPVMLVDLAMASATSGQIYSGNETMQGSGMII